MDRTPVKRKSPDDSITASSASSSSKFLKPCNALSAPCQRRGLRRASYFQKEDETPSVSESSPTAFRRAQLQLETVIAEGQYSPLKFTRFLQKPQATRAPNQITFSPLMKKLQRSPARNSISFPVVKRSASKGSTPSATIKSPTKSQAGKSFSRVLNFSEDTIFPDRSLGVGGDAKAAKVRRPRAGSVSGSEIFYPLSTPSIDWSLKTRIRFACNRQLPFHGIFKTVDEASGLNGFVRGEASSTSSMPPQPLASRLLNFSDIQSTSSSSSDNFSAELYRNTLVWQHPDVPWVKPFPRTPKVRPGTNLTSKQSSPPFIITPDGVIAEEMYSHFCQAFHSLFKLFRSKQCPYFYLCANEYTVVFRASGLVGCEEAHALITPTTTGFRKLLDKEGLEYTMPFHPKKEPSAGKSSSSSSLMENSSSNESGLGTSIDSTNEAENEEKPIEEDLEDLEPLDIDLEAPGGGNAEWLESLGLSQQDFPSLESSQIRRKQLLNQRKRLDDQTAEGRMKSLVRIVGVPNCQAFMAMLINNRKICVSSSGPLAGIPPTLLAPVAFLGATLKSMSIKQSSSVLAANGGTHLTTIDIVGPILPNNVFGLMNLFGRYCQPQPNVSAPTVVKSHLTTYDQSASFAIETGLQSSADEGPDGENIDMQLNPTFSVENLEGSGLDRRFLTAICTPSRQVATPLSLFDLAPSGIRYNRKQR